MAIKQKLTYALGGLLFFALQSCTFHHGSISSGSAAVNGPNFKIDRMVYGYASSSNIFGIGGNKKDGMLMEARSNLIQNAKLEKGEVIGQTTIDWKRTYFFPVLSNKVFLSAEVIDFRDTKEAGTTKAELEDKLIGKKVSFIFGGFTVNAEIIKSKENHVMLKFRDKYGRIRIKRFPKKNFDLE